MSLRLVAVVGIGAVLLAAGIASPSTVLAPTFTELIDNAREIFIGETVSRYSHWVDTPDGRAIVTLVTFRVDESLKGGLQTQTSLEFLGGTVGETTLRVSGAPEFSVGDRDILFVGNRNAISPVMGLGYGRFRVLRDPRRAIDEVRFSDGAALESTTFVGRPRSQSLRSTPSLSLEAFRQEIRQRLDNPGPR
ncbi:MAG: hypothetical protein ABJA98_00800 [Acidobacteriota bacterium]